MEVPDKHMVTEDPSTSTDWTTIGARIIQAATIASAFHMEEARHAATVSRVVSRRWNRESSGENG